MKKHTENPMNNQNSRQPHVCERGTIGFGFIFDRMKKAFPELIA